MPDKKTFVTWRDSKDLITKAIAVPDGLTSPDGRTYLITSWSPTVAVSVDDIITATIEVTILLEKDLGESK